MQKILIIITALLLSSCYQSRLNKWCARCPQTTKDSTLTTISNIPYDTLVLIGRHTSEPIFIPGDCPDIDSLLAAHNGTVTTRQDGIKSTITGGKGKPYKFTCETDSLKEVISLLRSTKQTEHYKEVVRTVEVHYLTWWDKFLMGSGGIFWLIIFVFVAWQVLKRLPN